ncbi:MAG: 3-keto-disaccharide hydrolase [Verrucomicrobiota bacterium]
MKITPVAALWFALAVRLTAAPDPAWLVHDRERPLPPVVNPGTPSTQEQPGTPPSDAVVLFDGKDLSAWVAMDGTPTKWVVKDGALECVPGSGYVRTLQSFGDCQLHIEWAAPARVEGSSQGRGNSGVFFGFGRYEIQVLDSYQNNTYADGSAASYYGEYPPLVNASRPPGQWQTYDIIWTAPRFDAEGKLLAKARLTVIHNGVVVQNNIELERPNAGHWFDPPPYQAHPERLPIAMQDHGNPVRYRNIWVREFGTHRHPAFVLPDALLETYAGNYGRPGQWNSAKIRRLSDGQLALTLGKAEVVMTAASPIHFYGQVTDVQVKFDFTGDKKKALITVGEDFSRAMVLEKAE